MTSLATLFRQRGYVALCLATIALAVGANLVVFTIVNALWLRPRPVTDPERIVMVMGDAGSAGSSGSYVFAEAGLQRYVRDVPAFALVAGQVMTSGMHSALRPRVIFDDVDRPVETIGVTSEYFRVLGLTIRGRDFTRDDDRYGAAPVAIISERLWKTAFGARPDAIGRVWAASPFPVQIIGVAPPEFHGARLGEQTDLWVPRNLVPRVSAVPTLAGGAPALSEGSAGVLAIARLHPWVTPAEAQRLVTRHEAAVSDGRTARLVVVPLSSVYGSPDHRTLIVNEGRILRVIAATALLVLIGGCATLMALVLVHYERRRHEFAIRLAIGASRGRLVRRLAAELGWLVALGSGGALLVAAWGVRALPALDLPGGVNLARIDLDLDWRVALAGLCASAVTIGAGACLPLLRFTHGGVARHLISPGATAGAGSLRLRKLMLGIHVGATVIVLVAASLFIRTIQYGFSRGAGFDVDRSLFLTVDVATLFDLTAAMAAERAGGNRPSGYDEQRRQIDRLAVALRERRGIAGEGLLSAVATLPTIEVLAVGSPPLGPDPALELARPKVLETDGARWNMRVGRASVGPDYLDALGLRLIEGRTVTAADIPLPRGPRNAVITASLATALWPGESALGRRVRMGYSSPDTDYEVVGVVEDFAFGSMRFDPHAVILTAAGQGGMSNTLNLVLRAANPEALVEPLRRVVTGLLPGSPRVSIATGRDLVAADLGRERLGAWFFSGFGLVGVTLGVGGVFGLIAYMAELRRREFGVRLALGATPADLLRVALIAGLAPSAIGAAVGLVGAGWLAKAAETFLIGVSPLDPASYAAAFVLMLTVAAGAGLTAAWRIRHVSPVEAFRAE